MGGIRLERAGPFRFQILPDLTGSTRTRLPDLRQISRKLTGSTRTRLPDPPGPG